MIRAGSVRTRMCGHRARSRGMCLLPIHESFHEDVSEHAALSKRSLQQCTSHHAISRVSRISPRNSPCYNKLSFVRILKLKGLRVRGALARPQV